MVAGDASLDLDRFLVENPPQRGAGCWVCTNVTQEERDALAAAWSAGRIRGVQAHKWLIARGYAASTKAKMDYHFATGRHHER